MVLNWFIPIIVDNVFSYILDQSGTGEQLKSKIIRDPAKRAFQHALHSAFTQFELYHPQWASALFDLSFFEQEGRSILAQFLLRNGHPTPSDLASCWAKSLNMHQAVNHTVRIRELEAVAADFLDYLNRALMIEPDLQELQDSQALERAAKGIDAISRDINAIRSSLENNKSTIGTNKDYLHWLIERNLYLDPRGTFQTQRQVQLKLDEIYVSLKAQHDETPGSVDRRLLERELAELEAELETQDLPAEEIEDQHEQLLARLRDHLHPSTNGNNEVQELANVVTHHEKLVILGDPGSGKTTLLRYIALKNARALEDDDIEVDEGIGVARFPILVRIADYAEFGMPKGKSLSDFLVDYCRMHECIEDGLADLFTTKLAEGNCLLLLDGLDEIVNADERRTVVRQIEEFVRRYDDIPNHFIITSRIAGYRSAPLGEPFTHYTVQEMDEAQIYRFLERWCVAVEAAQTPELSSGAREATAKREIEGIMNAVRETPGVRRLAANPLLLRILALIHHTGAQLPQKRIELYRLATDTLARTWRTAQGVPESALVKDEYLTPLLSKLAYWMHVNKPTGIITEREVYEVLGEEWANIHDIEWNPDKANTKIMEEVGIFLLAVREHTGLFVERAPKRYGFMHLTFEEYYAARYLVALSRNRAKLIRQHLHDPRWNEPILLALGFVGLEYPREAQELIETAVLAEGDDALALGMEPSKYEELLGQDFLFALHCLGDNIPMRPRSMQKLIKRLSQDLLYQTGLARFQFYRQALEESVEYMKGSEGSIVLSSFLIPALSDHTSKVRSQAAKNLGRLGSGSIEVISVLVKALDDNDALVRIKAAESLGRLRQPSDDVVAALLKALQDEDTLVSVQAAESLGKLKKSKYMSRAILVLIKALRNEDSMVVRSQAAKGLGRLGVVDKKVEGALLRVLNDAEPEVRIYAAESLGDLGQVSKKKVEAALLRMLRDENPRVRIKATEILGQLVYLSDKAVLALLSGLHDNNPTVRYQSAKTLGVLPNTSKEVLNALIYALNDYDPKVAIQVAESLEKLGQTSNDVAAVLLEALHVYHSGIRIRAAEVLGRLRQIPTEAVKALLNGLHEEDPRVRIRAVESLGRPDFATEEIIIALLDSLRDKNPTVRARAAESLGKLGQASSKVITALNRALQDYDPRVRIQAAGSLWQLGETSIGIETELYEIVYHSKIKLARHDAILLLGQIGRSDEPILKALRACLLDEDAVMRTAASQALTQFSIRFPSIIETAIDMLIQDIQDPMFNALDNSPERRPAYDYAYDILWALASNGRFVERSHS